MIFNNEEHLSEASQKEMKASLRLPKIEQLIIETNQQYQKALKDMGHPKRQNRLSGREAVL